MATFDFGEVARKMVEDALGKPPVPVHTGAFGRRVLPLTAKQKRALHRREQERTILFGIEVVYAPWLEPGTFQFRKTS